MIRFFKKLLGAHPDEDFDMLVEAGALIVDVRGEKEYANEHISGSVNIPLSSLPGPLAGIKKSKPLILCCESGLRSSIACNKLLEMGYTNVFNGGSFRNLKKYENDNRTQLRG